MSKKKLESGDLVRHATKRYPNDIVTVSKVGEYMHLRINDQIIRLREREAVEIAEKIIELTNKEG